MVKIDKEMRSLWAVLWTFAVGSLSATIVFPILAPLFLHREASILGASVSDGMRAILLGAFLAAFPLAQFLFSPIIGEYGDRKGRKYAFLITIALEAFAYAISALGITYHNLILLFFGRFLTGLAAGNMSVCLATLVDLSPNEKSKARYFSYGSAVVGLMFVLGPFIGGKLSDPTISPLFSAAFPMWVGGILALLNFFVILFFFGETLKEKSQEPFDLLSAIHNLQLAFRTERLRSLYTIYFFFLFGWNMIYQFIPAVMIEEFSVAAPMIGDVSALMGLIWIMGTLLMSWLLRQRFPTKNLLLISLLIFSFSSACISLPATMPTFLLLTAIPVFFAGGVWPIFTVAISNAADQKIQGKVMGLSQSIQSLSMMLAPLIGGFFLHLNSSTPFAISATAVLFAAALLTKTHRRSLKM